MTDMQLPNVIIFASGTPTDGGSGAEKLVLASRSGALGANITAMISNNEHGGVRERADRLKIPFRHFPGPWTKERYREITKGLKFDFVSLSGWLKLVVGLEPKITFNIHPGPRRFSGRRFYGHHVHEAVLAAFHAGEIAHTCVRMHFISDPNKFTNPKDEYDTGPCFFESSVAIYHGDSVMDLEKRVNVVEHYYQPKISNLVVQRQITWDGKDPKSLRVPAWYRHLPKNG